jgi:DNA-binding transcriptional LysR family regulator
MNVDLKMLTAFVEVGRTMSFTAASAKLGTSQPRISSRVQMLEERLGFRVFERSGTGVRFTSEGERLFEQAVRVLEEVERFAIAADEISQGTGQRFQIGASPLFTAQRWAILDRFLARYPSALPRVTTATAPVLLQQLRRKDIDLAFVVVPEVPAGVESQLLWTTRFGLVVPAGALPNDGREVAIDQLAARDIYVFPREASPELYAHLEAALKPLGVRLIDQLEGSSEAILQQVVSNGRWVISPRWWPPGADGPPGIEFRPIENIPDAVSFCVARSGSPLMRPASLLWEMLRREAEAPGEF